MLARKKSDKKVEVRKDKTPLQPSKSSLSLPEPGEDPFSFDLEDHDSLIESHEKDEKKALELKEEFDSKKGKLAELKASLDKIAELDAFFAKYYLSNGGIKAVYMHPGIADACQELNKKRDKLTVEYRKLATECHDFDKFGRRSSELVGEKLAEVNLIKS